MKIAAIRFLPLTFGLALGVGAVGCADDDGIGNSEVGDSDTAADADVGDGDTAEDGDADADAGTTVGDGDGDTGDGDGDTGDGDGDGDTGDGDGDTGDGDGDTGDGDGDTGDGDGDTGDGDGDTGDGDGDTGDGDGDTTTSTTGNNGNCEAPADYVDCDGTPGNLTTNPFQAIGINCGDDPATTVVATNAVMNSNNDNAWRIATGFGTAAGGNYNGQLWAANTDVWINPDMEEIPANTSTALLILSTGVVGATNGQGVVIESSNSQGGNGENNNEDAGGLPAPLSAQLGSNGGAGGTPFMDCDGVNDCSDSLYDHWYGNGWDNPNDKLWMQMDLTVPPGTEGYVFDFAYFSSEFPGFYETQYNDLFIAWSTSETYTGNITFVNDAPLTITSIEDAGAFQYKANAPELAGTGFEGNAGTGWFTARGSAAPEETFQLTFFITDMADSALATAVLLDNFRWECGGCIPNEVDSCGIAPQPQ